MIIAIALIVILAETLGIYIGYKLGRQEKFELPNIKFPKLRKKMAKVTIPSDKKKKQTIEEELNLPSFGEE